MQFEEDIHDLKTRQEDELSRFKAELEQEKMNLVSKSIEHNFSSLEQP